MVSASILMDLVFGLKLLGRTGRSKPTLKMVTFASVFISFPILGLKCKN